MQYLGGKSRISRRISEVIQYEVSRRKITNCETNRREDSRTHVREGGDNAWLACFAVRAQWRVRWQAILTSLY